MPVRLICKLDVVKSLQCVVYIVNIKNMYTLHDLSLHFSILRCTDNIFILITTYVPISTPSPFPKKNI